MRRALAAAVLVLLGLAACSKYGTSQATSSPTPAASTTASADLKVAASTVVDDLAGGKFDDVEAKFDATMKSKLSVGALQNNWRTYQELVGTYRSHGAPNEVKMGAIAVERVPIATTTGTGEVRISYHPDGTIAGLFFLRAGAPAP